MWDSFLPPSFLSLLRWVDSSACSYQVRVGMGTCYVLQGSWENRAGAESHQTHGQGGGKSRAWSGEWLGGQGTWR